MYLGTTTSHPPHCTTLHRWRNEREGEGGEDGEDRKLGSPFRHATSSRPMHPRSLNGSKHSDKEAKPGRTRLLNNPLNRPSTATRYAHTWPELDPATKTVVPQPPLVAVTACSVWRASKFPQVQMCARGEQTVCV